MKDKRLRYHSIISVRNITLFNTELAYFNVDTINSSRNVLEQREPLLQTVYGIKQSDPG